MKIEQYIQDVFVGNTPREPGNVIDITTNETSVNNLEDFSRVFKFYVEFSHKEVVPKNGTIEDARMRFVAKLRYELYKDLYEDLMKLRDAVAEERKGRTADIILKMTKEIKGDDFKRYGQ